MSDPKTTLAEIRNDMGRYISGWNLLTGEEPPPCPHSKIVEWALGVDRALDGIGRVLRASPTKEEMEFREINERLARLLDHIGLPEPNGIYAEELRKIMEDQRASWRRLVSSRTESRT